MSKGFQNLMENTNLSIQERFVDGNLILSEGTTLNYKEKSSVVLKDKKKRDLIYSE